ncbi:hypothetical protein [Caulobacter hibisci]|uniref:Glycosyl transferase family 8 n=1 Tax=Caulobacter hibisci TaxID=2035993 RepID=A0ABS0SVI8_9CAUL|nr:hypothetical protein [Caulobacter hibisci]MBI1683296.1 hypothetical protein [Caulobacter hibisci]
MHTVFTIVSRNYAAMARALMESVAAADPAVRRVVVVTDAPPGGEAVKVEADAELIDVWSVPGVTPDMALYYDALEFNTSVKPFVFKALLSRPGAKSVVYLDPDILLLAPLTEVREALAHTSLALTPHLTRPLDEGFSPDDQAILQSGSFNLGFLGARPSADTLALMDWWAARCRFDCRVDFAAGLFTDQRWMDLAPGMVDSFTILRQPDLNLAYWNLPSRQLAQTPDGWTVDGRPLTFFHFSGFDPARPTRLSRYQDRIDAESHPALRALLEHYAAILVRHGHLDSRRIAYGHGFWANGAAATTRQRRTALDAARRGEPLGLPARHDARWFEGLDPHTRSVQVSRLAGTWLRESGAGSDPARIQARLASAPEDIRASQDRLALRAVSGQARAEPPQETLMLADPAGLAGSARLDAVLTSSASDPSGAGAALRAFWLGRPDLRARFESPDARFMAWCLGPESAGRRFPPRLLPAPLAETLDPTREGLAREAAILVYGLPAQERRFDVKALFDLSWRAGWPVGPALAAQRQAWGLIDEATRLPALPTALWKQRDDLQAAFPLRTLRGRLRFMRWFARVGVIETALSLDAMPATIKYHPVVLLERLRGRLHTPPAPQAPEIWVRETLSSASAAPDHAVIYVAASGVFVRDDVEIAPPGHAARVIVETAPGFALADLMALRARAIGFDRTTARWSQAERDGLLGQSVAIAFDAVEIVD